MANKIEICLRDNLWSDKVNEVVMGEQYEDIGLMVSPEELAGLTFRYKSAEMSQQQDNSLVRQTKKFLLSN